MVTENNCEPDTQKKALNNIFHKAQMFASRYKKAKKVVFQQCNHLSSCIDATAEICASIKEDRDKAGL